MDVLVRITEGEAADELRSLRDWLAADDHFRGRMSLDPSRPSPGHMGTTVDVLTIAVGSGGAATVLAASISTWLRTRRANVTVEITESDDARTLKVTGSQVKDPEGLIREVLGVKDA